jgi:hypothetical protein
VKSNITYSSPDFISQCYSPKKWTTPIDWNFVFSWHIQMHISWWNDWYSIILRHTNKNAKRVYETYNINNTKQQLEWINFTVREFDAFLGLLIISGINYSKAHYTLDMWKTNSYPLYHTSMDINRFWNTLWFLRFDDANTRKEC